MAVKISDMTNIDPGQDADLLEVSRNGATGSVTIGSFTYMTGDDPDGATAGSIYAAKEPSGSVAPNARGAGAVDLQQERSDASQVAAGESSVIGGGKNNTINSNYSTVGGGKNNVAGGYYSNTISGGENNTITGSVGTIAGGAYNTISGYYTGTISGGRENTCGDTATVGGGLQNNAEGDRSVISGGRMNRVTAAEGVIGGGNGNEVTAPSASILGGAHALADRPGMVAHTFGYFNDKGDAQRVDFVMRHTTADDTPVSLRLNGAINIAGFSELLTIPAGKALFATVNVAGILSTGAKAAHYCRKVAIKNVGGTTSLIGAVSTIGTDVEDDVDYDVAITADDTNNALDISVTGKASETLRWVAHIEGVEIGYGS